MLNVFFTILMHPWQSVLLILITLTVFGVGFYYDQIEKDSALAYEDSLIALKEQITEKNEMNSSTPFLQESAHLEKSNAWAETKIILEVLHKNSNLAHMHKEAIKGDTFIASLLETLDKNPTAKELIFSPFINDFFSEPESAILQSLYSIALEIKAKNQLLLTVRGHSSKASTLLAKAIIDTYKRDLGQESRDKPLVNKLLKQRKEITMLEQNQLQLAEQIQEENENSSSQSIEEIAIRSELIQTTNEINSYVAALLEIEKIHLSKKDPNEYLTINELSTFGSVEEFLTSIDRLQRMLVNQDLEPILKKEVTKNLTKLKASLNQELAMGIEHIKELSRTALEQKIQLQKKLLDLEMMKNDIHSLHPRFKLLKSVKSQLDEKRAIFSADFQRWQNVKQGVVFTIVP